MLARSYLLFFSGGSCCCCCGPNNNNRSQRLASDAPNMFRVVAGVAGCFGCRRGFGTYFPDHWRNKTAPLVRRIGSKIKAESLCEMSQEHVRGRTRRCACRLLLHSGCSRSRRAVRLSSMASCGDDKYQSASLQLAHCFN